MTRADAERWLPKFEGLVKETASRIMACEDPPEMDFDDIRQLLRMKVWYALLKFSSTRAAASEHFSKPRDRNGRSPVERHVYGAIANMRKDIEKRPRRYNSSIDELRNPELASAEWFDARYLSVDAEQVFASVEDEFVLPSTLTELERRVVILRSEGLILSEITAELDLEPDQARIAIHAARAKLADWRPSAGEPTRAPRPPLPQVVPRSVQPQLSRVA